MLSAQKIKMSQIGGSPERKWPGRFQYRFMRICAAILLVSLLMYTLTLTEFHAKTVQSLESWNVSMFLQNTVYEIQNVIKYPKTHRKRKLVLLWTNYFSKADWLPSAVDLHCPVTDCDITSSRSMLNQSSAVILHWRNIDKEELPPKCVPSDSVQCPLLVLFNKEAPPHTEKDTLEAVQDRIYWTAMYRNDSDIPAPYGKVVPKKIRTSPKLDFDPKRRLLCWLVSNCNTPSKREMFVNELKNYIDVDIYGKCGSMQCPHRLARDCYSWLSERCMFYLSLENSICKDYTTEKLYHALSSGMVPVVMGRSSNYDHLPPLSFINAANFSSPKQLAEYLVSVGKDKNMYMSYLSWRRDYEVRDQSYLWFCDLCQKLHDSQLENVKPGRNLVSWWFDQSDCRSWKNL